MTISVVAIVLKAPRRPNYLQSQSNKNPK